MPLVYPSLVTYPPSSYDEMEPQWPGIVSDEYQDGGQDKLSLSDTPIRRFAISYQFYLPSEMTVFRTLGQSARYNPEHGSLISFSFTPPGEGALAGVHFDKNGLDIKSQTASGQSVYTITVKLIKRP